VLEQLWLPSAQKNGAFYKGPDPACGGLFLQKQRLRPAGPFKWREQILPYAPIHEGLSLGHGSKRLLRIIWEA